MRLLNNKYPIKYAFLELFLCYCVITLVAPFKSIDEDLWNFSKNHYVYWFYATFLIVFIVYFSKLTSSYDFRDEFYIPKFRLIFVWKSFWIFIKIFILFILILTIVYSFLFYLFPSLLSWLEADGTTSFRWKIYSKQALYLMGITALFTGGVEELFYRAFIITKLKQVGFSSLISAFLSSTIFGYGHLYYGFMGFFVTLIIGFALAYIYLIHKNVYYSIFVHSFYNITVSILLFVLNYYS
ncbi:CPBP family intramembrane glutamic endopeptidase [Candidatus Borreliella tachyglossi]|uniref:CPBP family intramembrane glutamic endopeptidase n=1 Tax=Candidatus Borreliella tachyglossi TaxID=1964448 RepID=UPI0040435C4E